MEVVLVPVPVLVLVPVLVPVVVLVLVLVLVVALALPHRAAPTLWPTVMRTMMKTCKLYAHACARCPQSVRSRGRHAFKSWTRHRWVAVRGLSSLLTRLP